MNQQRIKSRKKEVWRYLLFYTLGFALISIFILSIFIARGKSVVRTTDGIAQHFPALCYIQQYLKDLIFNGSFAIPMVDFSVGQGFDVIGTLNYYGFGDPFNLLTIFFPAGTEEMMYTSMIFLKIYLSGLAFSAYCCQIGKKKSAYVLAGALLYAFCNFSLFAGITHPLFLNGVLYLPLLLIGIERILKKKGIIFLAVTVGFAFMSNYYFMYMNTILAGIYLLIRLIGQYRTQGIRGFLKISGKVILAYIWGICLAAVILLPAVHAFMQNGRGIEGGNMPPLFYEREYYGVLLKRFTQTTDKFNRWSLPGTGVIGLFSAFILLVRHSKKERHLLVGLIVLILMLCFPPAGMIMNGFSYISNRWSYGFAFLLALLSVFELPHLSTLTKKQCAWLAALVFAYCGALFLLLKEEKRFNDIRNVLWIIVIFILMMGIRWMIQTQNRKKMSYLFTVVTFLTVLWNSRNLYHQDHANYIGRYLERGTLVDKLESSSLQIMSQIEDESFYRVEDHDRSHYNYALYTGDHAVNYYFSVVPGKMNELYKSVWLSANERVWVLNNLDSRTALDAITSVKYYVSSEEISIPYGFIKKGQKKNADGDTHYLYENQYALPIGYTYDSFMLRKDYDKLSPFERQRALLSSAVVNEEIGNLQKRTQVGRLTVFTKDVRVKSANKVKLKENQLQGRKGGRLTLSFEGEPDCETYLVFDGIHTKGRGKSKLTIRSNAADTALKMRSERSGTRMNLEGIMPNIGYSKERQTECTFQFNHPQTYHFDKMKLQCVSMEGVKEEIQERKKESLEQVEISTNQIKGTISATTDKVLQFSIPYSKGWKVYVDGKQTEVFSSDIAYMGIFIGAGEHDILLKYKSPGIVLGGLLTITGVMGIIIYLFFKRRRRIRS